MRKIITIAFLSLFLANCSMTRKRFTENSEGFVSGTFAENIERQNITSEGFFIQKAEIEISSLEINEKFIANVKFHKPDNYLISLRNRTGIEGARIYISGDSIFVNDRINKILYSGNSLYLSRKFGLSQSLLPIVFGDIVLDRKSMLAGIECTGSTQELESNVKGTSLNYRIDCNKRKVSSVTNNMDRDLEIRYSKFFKVGNRLTPGIIEMTDNQRNTKIRIKILKIELPWEGSLSFIPGKGYELIELL